MKNTAIIGAQWGDEGKGKISHVISPDFHITARFAGGDNAGHTVVFGDNTFKLHLIPSGIFYRDCMNLLGPAMVINPQQLVKEIDQLKKSGFDCNNLLIAKNAHLIFPFHRWADGRQEEFRKESVLGTTRRGIGPAYADKVSRYGIRMVDLLYKETFLQKLKILMERWKWMLGDHTTDQNAIYNEYLELGRLLEPRMVDVSLYLHEAMEKGRKVMFEGAQAVHLDLDFGTYPFVTSSSCIAGGIAQGMGIDPRKIQNIIGITKAYTTRIGTGPFPTEDTGNIGQYLLKAGNEYGTTTGRPRRCGWLDLVMLKYSCRVSALDSLALMKLDILTGVNPLKVCVGYVIKDVNYTDFPLSEAEQESAEPLYVEMEGWNQDISGVKSFRALPKKAREYVKFIETFCGVPVDIISVGPNHSQTIVRRKSWE